MRVSILSVVVLWLSVATAFAQTGKIAGTVVDASSGEALIGVNVVIEGTSQGSVTNLEGYYVILNVSPGTYDLRASYIGYTPQVVQGVRVNIDQTTEINFELSEQVIEGDEVIVTAERPVVQKDVAASQANITQQEIEKLPVSTVTGVVGLQAGIQGLSIRGGGSDELSFMVNGLTLRDERDNTPFTGISITSIEEVQVQTGGFNAEYGNVRSGVINVVTKEGGRNSYDVDVMMRYSPPAQKHFGALANDLDAYWVRPYVDPEVAYTGTQNGAWSPALQAQYPNFEGWNQISRTLLEDDNPANDMTPEALRQAFLWQHRKEMEITSPDYTMDVGFGGPVPGLSSMGNTRFYASYRRDQDMYLVPLSRDRYLEQSGHAKITSDVGPGMKLSVEGLLGEVTGTAASRSGAPGVFRSASGIAGQMDRVSFIDTRIFAEDYWAPTRIRHDMIGAKFSHALNSRSFYELRFTRFGSKYDTNPGDRRDTTKVVFIGGVGFDEGPFGFMPEPSFGVGGMRMGVGMSNARDTSRVVLWNLKGDFTSQLNRFLQVKTGIEYNITDSRINYGSFDEFLRSSNSWSTWNEYPVRGAAYAQGKLEFQGMIANAGLRLDYFNAGGDWFDIDGEGFNPFDKGFSARFSGGLDTLVAQAPTERIFTLSPRLGVSFPVTEFSKLFFNYGHFRQLPDPNNLFLVRYFTETGSVSQIANPNNPLPKTVAYELGYEHSLFDQFLIRLAGYYKDVSLQPRLVNFISRDGQTDYSISQPNAYEDIRGFELTFSRNRGRWLQGFVNYTYMVQSFGYFGFARVSENPTEQRQYEESDAVRRAALSRPVPQPYGRLNLDFITPVDFGPEIAGIQPLADWRVSFIGSWQAGSKFTWTGGGSVPGVSNNVQFKDYTNVNLRFAKNFDIGSQRAQFFVDVYNLFDQQRLSFTGFVDGNDYTAYMESLHLPYVDSNEDGRADYPNIEGDDRPGDYRAADVAFQPMEGIADRGGINPGNFDPSTIFFESQTGQYIEYVDGGWQVVSQSRIDEILDDKAYIDNPNQTFLSFLNPRDIYWGIRITF